MQLKAATVRDALMGHYLAGHNTQLCCSHCREGFVVMWQGTRAPRLSRRSPRGEVERRCYSQGTRYLHHLERHHGITCPTVEHAPVALDDLHQTRRRSRTNARLSARIAARKEAVVAEEMELDDCPPALAPSTAPQVQYATREDMEELLGYVRELEERILNLEVLVHAAIQGAPPRPSAFIGA